MSKTKARKRAPARPVSRPVVWVGLIVALVGLAATAFIWQSRTAPAAGSYPLEVTIAEAAAKRDGGAFILDVREADEWNDYHVPGSTLIPLGELPARVGDLPRDVEIVVVCRSGNRSATGRDILLAQGFTQVTSLAGGLTQWRAAGYPTVSGP